MQSPPRDRVESALAELIKESLVQHKPIHVPGLGSFTVRHEGSVLERTGSGEVVLMPPRDEIVFTPEWRVDDTPESPSGQ